MALLYWAVSGIFCLPEFRSLNYYCDNKLASIIICVKFDMTHNLSALNFEILQFRPFIF